MNLDIVIQTWVPVIAIWRACQLSEQFQMVDNYIYLGYLEAIYRQQNSNAGSRENLKESEI